VPFWLAAQPTIPRLAEPIADAAVLYLHGDAYVPGLAAAFRNFAGQLATRGKVATFLADCALAPERPFPAALDDAHAVYHGPAAASSCCRPLALSG